MLRTARPPTVFDPSTLGWVGAGKVDGWVARSFRRLGASVQVDAAGHPATSAWGGNCGWDGAEPADRIADPGQGSTSASVASAGAEAPQDGPVGDQVSDRYERTDEDEYDVDNAPDKRETEDTICEAPPGPKDDGPDPIVTAVMVWPLRGVNSVKLGPLSEEKYGKTPVILADVATLHVDVIRQPGGADLLIPFMLKDDELPLAAKIPDSLDSANRTALKELLSTAWSEGLQVTLTLGTLGLGGEFRDKEGDPVHHPIELFWSDAHVGQSLDGSVFCDGSTDETRRRFLDIRDRYQRRWLREYTGHMCVLLGEIEVELGAAFRLEGVIHHIEVFNEIDTCNVVRSTVRNSTFGEESWKSTAYWWARTCYGMARRVESALGGRIPSWLPAIASYEVDEALLDERDEGLDQNSKSYVHTWAWKINFYAEFARRFSILANRDGYTSRTVTGIAGGVDYHWYHRKEAAAGRIEVGPLHISRLPFEMERLRAALDSVGLDRSELTVQESGTSASSADEFCPHRVIDVEIGGATYDPRTTFDRLEVFQAQEVWRRQCGAAAGGAAILGWHAFQAKPDSPFAGTGLRDDVAAGPDGARPHLSYYAYKRFGSLLRYFSSCSLLTVDGEVVNHASDSGRAHDMVVFEFEDVVTESHQTHSFAYVVVLDRWRNTRSEEIYGEAVGGDAEVTFVDLDPNSVIWTRGTTPENLATGRATYLSDQVVSGVPALYVTLDTDEPCWFLYSDRRIAWNGWS